MSRMKNKYKSKKTFRAKPLKKRKGRQSRLVKHHQFLKRIFVTKNVKQRRKLVKNASKSEILTLVEFVYNIIKKNLPITSNQKQALCRYKKQLNILTNRKISCNKKRSVFLKTTKSNQRGGFLGLLASIGIPLLTSLISGLTGSNN
jgi:hypothetical protein